MQTHTGAKQEEVPASRWGSRGLSSSQRQKGDYGSQELETGSLEQYHVLRLGCNKRPCLFTSVR